MKRQQLIVVTVIVIVDSNVLRVTMHTRACVLARSVTLARRAVCAREAVRSMRSRAQRDRHVNASRQSLELCVVAHTCQHRRCCVTCVGDQRSRRHEPVEIDCRCRRRSSYHHASTVQSHDGLHNDGAHLVAHVARICAV
jgi:hypothetical protein